MAIVNGTIIRAYKAEISATATIADLPNSLVSILIQLLETLNIYVQ